MNVFLFEYKKRWEKICGEVKEYDNIDPVEAQKVDQSFSYSIKSSCIIDQPLVSRLERDQLISEQKVFFEFPVSEFQE